MTPEYYETTSPEALTAALAGKVVKAFRSDEPHADRYLVIDFEDGTTLTIRYDWIYDYAVHKTGDNPDFVY